MYPCSALRLLIKPFASFSCHYFASTLPSLEVMDAPTLPVSAERNLGDPIEIRVDIVHPAPVDVFPAATVVRTLAQHGEAIRGIHGHLQGVPINEEMSALRFRMGMAEEENASLRGKIKTMEATDTVTRRQPGGNKGFDWSILERKVGFS
ncbi:hypothetical protein Tco_0649835 [Tanacetum coccineum]